MKKEEDDKNLPKIADMEDKIKLLKMSENSVGNGLAEKDQLVFNPNPLYPALSDAIKIQYTKERGRFGVAARDIKVKCHQSKY